jgi:hypothetical protein
MADTCRSCGQPIVWAVTRDGKRMPVDPDPDPEGNLVLTANLLGDHLVVPVADLERGGAPIVDSDRRVSHFASCPNAASWRRG